MNTAKRMQAQVELNQDINNDLTISDHAGFKLQNVVVGRTRRKCEHYKVITALLSQDCFSTTSNLNLNISRRR